MKMKKLVPVMIMLAAVLILSAQAMAATITCPTTADVYIDAGTANANTNFNVQRVLVSYHSTRGIARGLLKFDIPAAIEGSKISSAIMYVSKNTTAGPGATVNVSIYALNTAFNEATDTWNTLNGGDYDGSVVSIGTLPPWTAWTTVPPVTSAIIDVTTLLAGNLDKVRNNGILMKLTNESGTNVNQNFATKEDILPSFAPYLEIIYTPTLVTLESFIAIPGNGKVTLQWATASEIDNAGFNIYRSEAGGEYVQINSDIIAAKGGATEGAAYIFVDENVQNRTKYSYKLEDLDLSGKSTMHEPKSATPRLIYIFNN